MTAHKSFRELVAKMSPEAQSEIRKGTAAILAEMELADLREALQIRQVDLAKKLETTQAAISRLETTNQDPKISTLRNYALAIGGELEVSVKIADRHISLTNFTERRNISHRQTRRSPRRNRALVSSPA
ncbi:MAG: helix-turn-helix domain-containing protein [Candidatus Acidiferrales bacterium]